MQVDSGARGFAIIFVAQPAVHAYNQLWQQE